jgi:hypothetical protein
MPFASFVANESGAVTVDWVVLTAALVGIGIASANAVRTGSMALGAGVDASLTNASVAQLRFGPYQFRTMTNDAAFWNSIPERRAQMARTNDATLEVYFWQNGLDSFNNAVDRLYNDPCLNCRGAGNRLDLMQIIMDEMTTRGTVTSAHRDALSDAETRFVAAFGQ